MSTDGLTDNIVKSADERDKHAIAHLQRRAAVIQWLVPLVMLLIVFLFALTEHVLLCVTASVAELLTEIVFFGMVGPIIVWGVVYWLRTVLAQQVQKEQAARLAYAESDRLNQQMAAIQRLSTSLASSLDLREVLDTVLPGCLSQIGYTFSAVLLIDESERTLQLSSVSLGIPNVLGENADMQPNRMLQGSLSLSDEHHPAVRAAATGQNMIANGLSALMGAFLSATACEQIEQAYGIRSIGLIPLQGKQQTIGVLAVGAPHRALTLDDLVSLIPFANQSAAAIENARLYKALQRTEVRLRAALERAITAQEDERKRIARELHDETAQALAALGIGIETAEALLSRDSKAASAQLTRLRETAVGVHSEIKRIILDLRPTLLDDLGLMPAISWYAEERLSRNGIAVHIEAPEKELPLPPLIETMLFRVAQEAINNIARHSNATRADIALTSRPQEGLLLRIQDDGCGFDPQEVQQRADGGFGLMGIRERWAIVGGIIEITSEANKGTSVCVGLERAPNCTDCPRAKWQSSKLVCQCPERWKK